MRYTRELLAQSAVMTAGLAGVRVGLGERVEAALTYTADVRGDSVGHVASATLRVRW